MRPDAREFELFCLVYNKNGNWPGRPRTGPLAANRKSELNEPRAAGHKSESNGSFFGGFY